MSSSLLARDVTASDSAAIAESRASPARFAAIFDRHYLAVHRYLARRAPAGHADDLASTTFVVAFERRHTFRPESSSARPWLLGIATNLLHERRRTDHRQRDTVRRLGGEPRADVEEARAEGPTIERLDEALAGLDAGQRDVLLLHAWEELSYEEIAEALEVPIGTVRSRLARARAHIRGHLAEAQPADGWAGDQTHKEHG